MSDKDRGTVTFECVVTVCAVASRGPLADGRVEVVRRHLVLARFCDA